MAPSDAVFVALLLTGLLRTAVAAPAPESAPATPAPAATPLAEPPNPATPPPPMRRTRIGASAAGHLTFGAAPEALPGIALYVMAELDRDGRWSPAIFVGASRTWRNELPQAGASASFTLDAVSVDACPLRWRFWVAVARPCAVGLVGRMTASGATDAVSATRPFALAGAALTASFGKMVELTTRFAVGVTLIRDSYELGGDVFYRAGPITTTFSLGFGKSWP